MKRPLNDTPSQDFIIHIGAPKPVVFQLRQGDGGVLRAFNSTLVMRVRHPAGSFDLTVGNGITLNTSETVDDALVTARLTVEQSRLIPIGSRTRFEFQEIIGGAESVILMGSLIGKGGDNPDV
jgi:hypothetical protein